MTKMNLILRRSLLGMFLLLGAIGVQAATLTVNTTADAGVGSLRQALIDATDSGANDIVFAIPTSDIGYDAPTNRFTIALASQLPDVPLAPTTITNTQLQAITIMGNNTFPILSLVNSAVVVITNLTLSGGANGSITAPSRNRIGKAGFGKARLGSTPFGLGGAIYMGDSGTLTLNRCSITNSQAATSGGAIYMSDSGTLFVHNSTMSGNSAIDGGAIYVNNSGTVNMDTSTISGNSAISGSGGGLYNGTSGTVNAASNTFDGNNASGNGGGVYNTATVTFTNNTVSSNTAGTGGGIYNNATATLNNNLVALNTAASGNDLFGGSVLGGIAFTGVYNLIGNADDSLGLGSSPNRSGTTALPIDPKLGPLQNNGGPTLTRALIFGSPAIDKGNSLVLITDQRGMNRPVDYGAISNDGGNGADIGAFEGQLGPTAANVSVSGRVLTDDGRGVRNAVVSITDSRGVARRVTTSSFGFYRFDDVQVGASYVLGASSKLYRFASRLVTVTDELTDVEFFAQQ